MSVMMESVMNPDLESTAPNAMSQRNFFIIGSGYMLLQARYGYHFCTVESQAGPDGYENFVSFQFKGGAADSQRRRLRAAMLADLLEGRGFRADVKDDSLFAVAEGEAAEAVLRKTRLLGYLLIHTRQVDMIMLDAGRPRPSGKSCLRTWTAWPTDRCPVADLTPNSPDEKLSFGDALCPMSTSRSRRRGSAHHGTESGTHSGRDRSAGPRAGQKPRHHCGGH